MDNSCRPVVHASRVEDMARFIFLICFIISTAKATSPIVNETDDSLVPQKCPPNEVLKYRTSCPPDSCDMLFVSVLCSADQKQEYVCTCKEGYLRRNNTCVPEDRCLPAECAEDPNAVRGCGNRCGKTCTDYNNKAKVCNANFCNLYGCECKETYVYDESAKICVKPEQCTSQCEAGYLRDKSGKCVPQSQCPAAQCKKENERWSNCVLGECRAKTCDEVGLPVACPDIIGPCAGGCVCQDGFVTNSAGDCIEIRNCPSKQCQKKNERWSKCLLGECRPKTCDDVGFPVACPDIIGPCAGGCICEEGFVRNSKGDCIEMKNCPRCGGDPKAVSGCGNPCGKTCASLYANKSELICPQYCEYNGCDCKPGYRLLSENADDTRKCVPERECPKPPRQCGANEQYYCGSSCPEASCANPTPPTCINKKCKLACFCKKGYVRDSNNKCVLIDKCPTVECTRSNEEFKCKRMGDWENCDERFNSPPFWEGDPDDCEPKCTCINGYYRNPEGNCVLADECPPIN